MPRRNSTEESVSGNKRNQSPPPAYGSEDEAAYRQQFPLIGEMIASQSTQDSEESVPPDPAPKPPANRSSKRQKRGTSNERAREPLCCPCSRGGTCAQRGGTCVCVQNRRACTNCDPLACGRCKNTHRAVTGRIAQAQLNRDRLIASLNAQPRSSLSQQSQDEANTENTSTNDSRTDTSGLANDAPANGNANNSSPEPSTANTNDAPSENVQGERAAEPPAVDERRTEQNTEEGNADINGTAEGGTDSTADGSTTGGDAVEHQGGDGGGNVDASSNSRNGESDQLDNDDEEEAQAQQNNRNQNIGWDAGLEVPNDVFNDAHELRSFDVGYRVIEADPRLQELSIADWKLLGVYGDTIHQNDGIHLDGGIVDDLLWQRRWRKVVSTPLSLWYAPKGKIGRAFVEQLTKEWRGVRERHWNSEKPLIFAAVVLRRKASVRSASSIKATIEARLKLWEAGRFAELVGDCVAEGKRGRVSKSKSGDTEEELDSIGRRFNTMFLSGKVRGAVRFATDREAGGPLSPDGTDSKTGNTVIDVLRSKHPLIRVPNLEDAEVKCFEGYPYTPCSVPHAFDEESIAKVAGKLHGSAGPAGIDADLMKSLTLRHGLASAELRSEMALWAEWMANESPPWAAIRAVNAKRLAPLDKKPGVRPVHVGEIYQRLWAKQTIASAGESAKTACGNVQLCAGLEAGVEGNLHAVREYWPEAGGFEDDEDAAANNPFTEILEMMQDAEDGAEFEGPPMENPGVTLVDAANGFNELNRYAMLWNVRHRWAAGARFAFNSYRHFLTLVVRTDDAEDAYWLEGQEGLSQGDPFAMLLYGIALMPLAERMLEAVPGALQPWFADDSAVAGTSEQCADCLDFLCQEGPAYGYFPEPEKSWHISKQSDEAEAKVAFAVHGLDVQFTRGHRYLGGFLGSADGKHEWLEEKVKVWAEGVKTLARIALRYPQTAYAGLVLCLQNEWQYVQRTCPSIGFTFAPIEVALREEFIPALLGVESISGEDRELYAHGVKRGGLAIRNPVETAVPLYESSKSATSELVESMLEGKSLNLALHQEKVKLASEEARKTRAHLESALLREREEDMGPSEKWRIRRSSASGTWLTCLPSWVNGTELSKDEFQDNIRLRYNLKPLCIPERCDGCGAKMTVEHALSCKVGGLVHVRHDDVADEFGHLCGLAFKPSRVTHEPLINSGTICEAEEVVARRLQDNLRNERRNLDEVETAEDERADQTHNPRPEFNNENRADKGVIGFWKRNRECLFDVRITDTEGRSTRNQDPERVIAKCEKEKKDKHLEACLYRRKDFVPLVYSVDGLSGREAKSAERRVASALAWKWKRHYSEMCGYVRARMALAVVRANTLLLRSSRVRRSRPRPQIEDGASMEGWHQFSERF
ncbi:hypothetical protein ACHAWO_009861 [Cyclotella atomus]|uniref:Reverse transcriptase domain-containing protein n=1 Tax=Cyclotella atomus TaxID=382360 RepID=A0ABD3Q644_9STRA